MSALYLWSQITALLSTNQVKSACFREKRRPASEGAGLLQGKPLPELRFHTNIFLLQILKASCDFVKGSILTTDFNEASNFLESTRWGFHPGWWRFRTYLACLHGPHIFKDQVINIVLDVHLWNQQTQFRASRGGGSKESPQHCRLLCPHRPGFLPLLPASSGSSGPHAWQALSRRQKYS